MQAVRFIAVGDVMVDVLAEGEGHAARIAVYAGGSAPNAAVWAASLGAEATVIGRVGDDAAGRMIRSELEARSVRAGLSVDPEAPTGTFLRVNGDVRASRGANATLTPEHLPALEADTVLVSGYLPRPVVEAALVQARARWVALDAARLHELPSGGNVLLANETAATRLDLERGAPGYEVVVVTRGARGAIARTTDTVIEGEPPRTIEGEPVGAGDAFAAALLVSLARDPDARQAMASACAVAADAADRTWPS